MVKGKFIEELVSFFIVVLLNKMRIALECALDSFISMSWLQGYIFLDKRV